MKRSFFLAIGSLSLATTLVVACADDDANVGSQGNDATAAGNAGKGGSGAGGTTTAGAGGTTTAGTGGANTAGTGGTTTECAAIGGTCKGVGDCGKGEGFLASTASGCQGGSFTCCLEACGGEVEDFVCCDATASFRPNCDGQKLVCLPGKTREACGGGGAGGNAGGAGGTAGTGGTAGAGGGNAGAGGATDKTCGGIAGVKCGADEYCDYDADSQCGIADQLGLCKKLPSNCGDGCPAPEFQPCACDGNKYCNLCEINAKGLSAAPASFCKGGAAGSGGAGGAGGGKSCGGLGGGTCGADEFCDYPEASSCGVADGTGACKAKPIDCGVGCPAPDFQPCACDGQKYCNVCEINKKGLSAAPASFCK